MQSSLNIAIVGSGLVGSLLAIYLKKRVIRFMFMIEVQILEKYNSPEGL